MKYFSAVIIILVIICRSQSYSQTNDKGLSFKVKDLKTVVKDGKTSWTARTILTNHTRDTLFYFSTTDCEPAYYMVGAMVDTIQLFADFKNCETPHQTVIVVPPSGQRTVDLEIKSVQPVRSNFKLMVFLTIFKAKNFDERIPQDQLTRKKAKDRFVFLVSKRIKVKMPATRTSI